ncbi:hypothetical protein D3C84_1298320 [compost metagenome]
MDVNPLSNCSCRSRRLCGKRQQVEQHASEHASGGVQNQIIDVKRSDGAYELNAFQQQA